ncbi:membrane protein insertase YidC [Modestobacter italicus]|uniref:membrane protein insertase YidC n=1 Tax=Modestobacter italicus (strain DSM 44449 / CECT 9708 / BC 501) TaxID=2732864 RepID=UPI001C985CDB|nr:membrane protein insertase YidC [Modestobacter italicus]
MLDWLYTVIAWTLAQWHALLATFLDPAGGPAWVLAIVLLVITVRLLLFPLFVRQLRSQRAVQELQPEIRALRERHSGDAQRLSREVLALQQERGVNPLAGCLPALLQAPVFLALLHVLRRLAPGADGLYGWSWELTQQAAGATLAGAPISSSFTMREPLRSAVLDQAGASETRVQVVATVLIVAMCLTSFLTQKLTQRRAGPVEGQAATVQRVLLYGLPAGLLVTGFFFPVGVLLYWTTSNLWTLGQQLYVLRRMPPPAAPPLRTPAPAPRPGAKPAHRRRRKAR